MVKFINIPIINNLIQFLKKIKPNSFYGFSFYDILRMYIIGIIKGALSSRAGSISFSFFMAIFPFILFILNLIPFIDLIPFLSIQDFDKTLLTYIEFFIPSETQSFFNSIFEDIQNKPRGGLLSSVFVLSIIFTANGVSAIFSGFEDSYHIELSRNFFKQYLYSIAVSVLLAFLFLFAVVIFFYFEFFILKNFSLLKAAITNSLLKFKISKFDLSLYKLSCLYRSSIFSFSQSKKNPDLCCEIIKSYKYFP